MTTRRPPIEADRHAVVVRLATPADLEAQVDLDIASGEHHAAIDPEGWAVPSREAAAVFLVRRQQRDPTRETLVATIDDEVVGMVELAIVRPGVPGGAMRQVVTADLGIVVAPGWRDRGIGTALMAAAEQWARDRGARRMILDVIAANVDARRFYERLGYEVYSLQMRRDLGDADEGGVLPGAEDRPGA